LALRDLEDVVESDVLVVGGGGAGARAAIEAKALGASVALAVKGLFGKSGCTPMAEGGYAAAIGHADPRDSPDLHFEDTIVGGGFLNEQPLVRVLVDEAAERLYDLERFGGIFDRTDDGRFVQNRPGGHRYARACQHGDRTGHELMSALRKEALRREIDIYEEVMVVRLLTSEGAASGALGLNVRTGGFVAFKAKSTVLATGGLGQLYPYTTNPVQKTGDGYAMAFRLGAELMDMEMVQFHPTGLAYPPSVRGVLITEACRSRGGVLLNGRGERFMSRYDPERMELSTRDVVSRAIFSEVRGGRGTEHGGVYLDITKLPPAEVEEYLFGVLEKCLNYVGVDPRERPVEVSPTCHHFMGGLRINTRCETSIPGLFACGESAGGVQGSNRLGTNGVTATQVFGARAGRYAAEKAKSLSQRPLDREQIREEIARIEDFERGEGSLSPASLRSRLQGLMWESVGIIRDRQGLTAALAEIQRITLDLASNVSITSEGSRYGQGLVEVLELENMLLVAELVTRSALLRTESRGAHFRSDYPKRNDDQWLRHVTVKRVGNEPELGLSTVSMDLLRPEA
jgi:fumarate reductase (CoM/CoB) subunit A